jgi:Zn-finger nucleic acid-binding protein
MKCPVCENSKLEMTERQGIEIDYCPDCRGVWLDRGELDKIIERSASQNGAKDQTAGFRDDKYGDDRQRKKKKSFLGELLDF